MRTVLVLVAAVLTATPPAAELHTVYVTAAAADGTALERIGGELHNQYVVSYEGDPRSDGRVTIERPGQASPSAARRA